MTLIGKTCFDGVVIQEEYTIPPVAAEIAAKWVAKLGMGFHPDTRGADYTFSSGERCFNDIEAAEYDADMDTLFGLCCPYEAGLRAMLDAGLPVE